jgi:hypothetical protein
VQDVLFGWRVFAPARLLSRLANQYEFLPAWRAAHRKAGSAKIEEVFNQQSQKFAKLMLGRINTLSTMGKPYSSLAMYPTADP